MTFLTRYDVVAPTRERVVGSLAVPLGFANPFWFAFAASAGSAAMWWLMTRWAAPVGLSGANPPAKSIEAPAATLDVDAAFLVAETAMAETVIPEPVMAEAVTAEAIPEESEPLPVAEASAAEPSEPAQIEPVPEGPVDA